MRNFEGKRTLVKPRHRWKNNIKIKVRMAWTEIICFSTVARFGLL
jgi:hypothetical protein